MSLVSVYTNLNIVKEQLKYINNVSGILNNDINSIVGYIISDCAVKQYDMKIKYLNINMLNKRHIIDNLSSYELLDTLYQHIYMHNHIGMEDELYEVSDAYDKYENLSNLNEDENKIMMSKLLILEEFIDAYHFITELTGTLKEHFLLTLEHDKINSKRNILEYYYTGENDFTDNVKYLINNEGQHIAEDLLTSKPSVYPKFITTYEIPKFIEYGKNVVNELLKLNREYIREVNFKDWKQYPDNYFDAVKFAKLSNINRDMYYMCLNGISYNLKEIGQLTNSIPDINTDYVCKMLYAVYNQKRQLNIERQLNDPRYKINNNGDIIGDII